MTRKGSPIVITGFYGNTGIEPPVPTPIVDEEAVRRARYDADQARAEADRIKRELDEIKAKLPTDDQRARWSELEEAANKAEEERRLKAGEFEAWRVQVNERHQRELEEQKQLRANEEARRVALDRELEETLIGREFADAVKLFGPTGRTVLLPSIAKDHFAKHVSVEVTTGHDGRTERKVIVKDAHGATIVDPKTGKPASFEAAMNEVIDAHPQREWLLRGSGKVGAGSSGGGLDGDRIDFGKLRPSDFQRPEIRDAVRQRQNSAGGLQVGPGFDMLKKQAERGRK